MKRQEIQQRRNEILDFKYAVIKLQFSVVNHNIIYE